MRLVSVLVSFVALVATCVLVVAVVKLQREAVKTRAEVAALRESCQGDWQGSSWIGGDERGRPAERVPERTVTAGPRLAPSSWAPAPGLGHLPTGRLDQTTDIHGQRRGRRASRTREVRRGRTQGGSVGIPRFSR